MSAQFSNGCSVNSFIGFIQEYVQVQEGDTFQLIWAKEILGALLILALFWVLSQLTVSAASESS